MHDENREIGRAWMRAFNAHDVEALVALYADDATHTSPKIRALSRAAQARDQGDEVVRHRRLEPHGAAVERMRQ